MSKITINVPLEGAKTATTDLTDADSAWISASGNVDGTNIREEGLDRRVIKSTAWTKETGDSGTDNFYSSGKSILTYVSTTSPDYLIVPAFDSATGGADGDRPVIQKYWNTSKDGAILVRCSFRVSWDTLGFMSGMSTSPSSADKILAQIASSSLSFGIFGTAPGGLDVRTCGMSNNTFPSFHQLSEAFGSQYAGGMDESDGLEGNMLDISNPYDRRSNFYASVTLVDSFTAEDPGSNTSGYIQWGLRYRANFNVYSDTDDGRFSFPEIHDINFAAHRFVR